MHDKNQNQGNEGDGRVVKQHRPDNRNICQQGNVHGREFALRNRVAVEQIGREAGRQDDDNGAGDDLIHLEAGGQGGMDQSHQGACGQRRGDAKEQTEHQGPTVGRDLGHETHESARQHHSFDADIDNARPLAQNAAQGPQDEGHGGAQGKVKGADAK